ncbi:VWA domain-containing protein [Shewanella oncorhynchi]|uniref:VWA domain-containing protein n=1 Tax=Shewanella oncorhynchi TaxID=2726434 RepID=UPI003D7A89C5
MSTTNVALPNEKPMNPALLAKRKRALLRKFTLLQQMNTGKSGRVEICGTRAGTTGNKTVLPLGNLEDPEYLDMLEGMIDHENGHCKHTDFSVWFAIKNKLVKQLTNIFEDVRIEKLVSNEYPGAKTNLLKLVDVAIKRGLFTSPSSEDDLIAMLQKYFLYYGRYQHLDQYSLRDYAQGAKFVLSRALPNAFPKLEMICNSSGSTLSTNDAKNLAEEVLRILREEQQEQQQQEQQEGQNESQEPDENQEQGGQNTNHDSEPDNSQLDNNQENSDRCDQSGDDQSGGSGDSEMDDSDDESNDDQSGGSGDSEMDDSDDESNDDQSGGSGDSEMDDAEDNQSGDNENGGESEGGQAERRGDSESDEGKEDLQSDPNGEQQIESDQSENSNESEGYSLEAGVEDIEKALNADDPDLLEDMHEAIRRMMEEKAEEHLEAFREEHNNAYAEPTLPFPCIKSDQATGIPQWMPRARTLSQKLKTTLHSILYDRNRVKRHYDNQGSEICAGTLWGVKAGNSRIFKTENISKAPNTAFSILVDRSGSMRVEEMDMANVAAFAIAQAIEFIKGAECEVMYYPYCDSQNGAFNHLAKAFNERIASTAIRSFNVRSAGGTPTAEAVQGATGRLAMRKEERKILFLITDGDTEGPNVSVALNECDVLGITVIGIGINTGKLAGFEHRPHISINSSSELDRALFNYLKDYYRA